MGDIPLIFYFAASLSVLLVGVAKTGFGGGIGVVAVPLMMAAAPPDMRAGAEQAILLPILCFCDIFAMYFYWRRWSTRDVLRLLPGGMAGIIVGALLMKRVSSHKEILQLAIGILAMLFLLFEFARGWLDKRLEDISPGWKAGGSLGGLAGFASMVAHAGGPPVVMYLLPRRLSKEMFVGTTVVFFTVANYTKLIPYSQLDLFTTDRFLLSLVLAPFVPLGTYLGYRINRVIDERLFRGVIYALLLATAVKLIYTGTSGIIVP
jgi:uncharacterized membrane protein YfcA